jgi:hypothetical protein
VIAFSKEMIERSRQQAAQRKQCRRRAERVLKEIDACLKHLDDYEVSDDGYEYLSEDLRWRG